MRGVAINVCRAIDVCVCEAEMRVESRRKRVVLRPFSISIHFPLCSGAAFIFSDFPFVPSSAVWLNVFVNEWWARIKVPNLCMVWALGITSNRCYYYLQRRDDCVNITRATMKTKPNQKNVRLATRSDRMWQCDTIATISHKSKLLNVNSSDK